MLEINNESLIKRGQESSLQIRKEKLNEKIMAKRLHTNINKQNNKFEICPESLKLDENFLQNFEKTVKI